jgi:Domain of unknown function (DUF1735)
LLEAPENNLFFSPFTDVKSVDLFSIRKDPSSKEELNKATTITLLSVPAYIDRYNDANGTSFEVLPDSLYTLDNAFIKNGDKYTYTFASGKFAKEFTIKLSGAKWDISHTYAVAFALSDVSGKKISSGADTIIATVSVKNKYDGIYTVTGTFSDASNAAFVGAYPLVWELHTSGPTQCVVYDNVELGFPGYLFNTGTGLSYFGSFGLIVNFDPATDKIVSVENYYGQPAANTRSAELDPSGINAYDAATQTVNIKYFMKQPRVITAAPNIRCFFNEVWKYKGPR